MTEEGGAEGGEREGGHGAGAGLNLQWGKLIQKLTGGEEGGASGRATLTGAGHL